MNGRSWRRVLLSGLAASGMVLAIASIASTAAMASTVPGIAIDPTYGPPLTTVKISGTGFCGTCGTASIQIGSLYVATNIQVTSSGQFTTFAKVPGTTRPGTVPIIATQTGKEGARITARADFSVTVSVPAPTSYPPPATQPPPGGLPSAAAPLPAKQPGPSGTPTTSTPATVTPTPPTNTATAKGSPTSGALPGTRNDSISTPGSETGMVVRNTAIGAAILLALGGATIWIIRRRRRPPKP